MRSLLRLYLLGIAVPHSACVPLGYDSPATAHYDAAASSDKAIQADETAAPAGNHVDNMLFILLEDFPTASSPAFSQPTNNLIAAASMSERSTPYMEKLASEGVTFTNVHCQAPICNPSRTSLLTSRRPSITHVFTNTQSDDEALDRLPSLNNMVQASRPDVTYLAEGKIYHEAGKRFGFDQPRPEELQSAVVKVGRAHLQTAMDNDAHLIDAKVLHDIEYLHAHLVYHKKPNNMSADMPRTQGALFSMAYYANQSKPFWLSIGYESTHVQNNGEGHSACQQSASEWGAWKPVHSSHIFPDKKDEHNPPFLTWPNWDFHGGFPTHIDDKWRRETTGKAYACATHVDRQVGALVAGLDLLKLRSTTAVGLVGDHGWSIGLHQRWSKYNLWADGTRVPMIWSVPGGERGKVVHDVVESLDVLPTLLDLWGVKRGNPKVPGRPTYLASKTIKQKPTQTLLDGYSLMEYIQPGKYAKLSRERDYALSELRQSITDLDLESDDPDQMPAEGKRRLKHRFKSSVAQLMIRSKAWSYQVYLIPPANCLDDGMVVADEALYDLSRDPGESKNLAYDEEHEKARAQMLKLAQQEWSFELSNWTKPDREARLAMVQTAPQPLPGKCKDVVKLGGDALNLYFP